MDDSKSLSLEKKYNELEKINYLLMKELRELKIKSIDKPKIEKTNNIQKSSKENTIIFVSFSEFNKTKKLLLSTLIKNSFYKIVVGVDSKFSETTKTLKLFSNSIEIVNLDNNKLIKKFGNKIDNFNGRWADNPAKLGAYDWFNDQDKFVYMWYIEDDVYAKNWDLFFEKYENFDEDLIYRHDNTLPFWYFNNWKVGNKKHAITHGHLYVHRINKHFAKLLNHVLNNSNTTSHHELFIPFVRYKFDCSSRDLDSIDRKYCYCNVDANYSAYNLEFINKNDSNLFHPVKNLDL